MPPEILPPRSTGLVDVLDRVLDKGLLIAGDIGARALEPDLRRLATDPDPDVARAARDALETLSAREGS